MTETTITTDVHQALDVHRGFTTQIAFNGELGHFITNFFKLMIGEIFDFLWNKSMPQASQILRARLRPTPKMAVRPISECFCGGMLIPAIRAILVLYNFCN
jgi:hypothetical protein